MEDRTRASFLYSVYDGILANMFATLTGGVFLTGFALYLGMNEFLIGLLGAMPFLVTVIQFPTAYFVDRRGRRKQIAFWCSLGARTIWLPILAVGLLPVLQPPARVSIVLALIFVHYALGSASFVAWLSWMSDLVPDRIRGAFFGTRNMLAGAASMVVMVAFGSLLDWLEGVSPVGVPVGFAVTFLAAVLFGMASAAFLRRVAEPRWTRPRPALDSPRQVLVPFRDPNFRRFLAFSFFWGFAVYFAAPFFPLYFLRDLGYGYGFVAALGMLSAFADMVGMRLWGKLSDRTKNKPIIYFAGWWAVFLPLGWVLCGAGSVVLPIVLSLLGGGMWAGVNLCVNNLLLRISPREHKALYLSTYNVVGGLGAALGPITAGLLLQFLGPELSRLLTWQGLPLHVLFLLSTAFRLAGLQWIRTVREPEEVSVEQMIRIIRSVRGLNVTTGFAFLLHPFVDVSGSIEDGRERGEG